MRTLKKRIGKDDVPIIPASSVSHVDLDRKTMRSDTVTVHVGNRSYEWKTAQAEALAHAILALKD